MHTEHLTIQHLTMDKDNFSTMVVHKGGPKVLANSH